MHPKYIAAIVFIFAIGSLLGALMAQSSIGQDAVDITTPTLVYQVVTTQQTWSFWTVATFVPTFFLSIFNMITFNFPFLQGSAGLYFKWAIGMPIGALITFGIISTLIWLFSRVLGG